MKAATHAAALAAGIGPEIANGMHAAALPDGVKNFGYGSFKPHMCVRDHKLDATQAAACQAAQKFAPERFRLRRSIAMPCTTRLLSELTPEAMVTDTETMRPASRTFR